MKYVQLYEQFVNEKAYRLTGIYASKGIIGKVMQAFKKQIERSFYDGDAAATLVDVNKEWKSFHKDASEIILSEIKKVVKDMGQVVYVHVSGLNRLWEADEINKLNREGGPLYITIVGDFVINVGFRDDVDASKFGKKLDGYANTAIPTGEDIYGQFDSQVGYNNIEIRDSEYIMIDSK